jgi:hypothetical protein
MDKLALRVMTRMPNWMFKLSGAKFCDAHAEKLVKSASGLCVITAPDASEPTDLAVGRAMQRAWLARTREGLAAQPMMSLMVLDNLLENGSPDIVESVGRSRILELGQQLRRLLSIDDNHGHRPAFLLRFGYAAPASGRTGRLPSERVTGQLTTVTRRASEGEPTLR